jgi:acetyl esterase
MALDPVVKALLDQLAAQPVPPMWEMEPPMARAAMLAAMELMGQKDVPIGQVENISMPGPGGEIALRVYSPVAGGSSSLPGLVFFHGGGWVIGDLDTHDGLCRQLANEAGVRVVSVHYRLAPDHKYPAAIDDAMAAVTWVEANAAQLGIDANCLAVGGDSAGGALAAIVAQQMKAKGGAKLAFQMLFFPVTQIGEETVSLNEFAEGYFLERNGLFWFYEHYLPSDADRNDPRVSPLRSEDMKGLPPAYVMLAGFDPLHDEGLAYAERLRDAGVAVQIADYPDMVHDFILMQAVVPQAQRAIAAAGAALKAVFEG